MAISSSASAKTPRQEAEFNMRSKMGVDSWESQARLGPAAGSRETGRFPRETHEIWLMEGEYGKKEVAAVGAARFLLFKA